MYLKYVCFVVGVYQVYEGRPPSITSCTFVSSMLGSALYLPSLRYEV